MSVGRTLIRPRARAARLARTGSVPVGSNAAQGAGPSEALEVAAGVGGVILGALAGDLLADGVVREPSLEIEPAAAGVIEQRLVRIENEMRTRSSEERRATYIVIGSIIGGIAVPFLARWLVQGPAPQAAVERGAL